MRLSMISALKSLKTTLSLQRLALSCGMSARTLNRPVIFPKSRLLANWWLIPTTSLLHVIRHCILSAQNPRLRIPQKTQLMYPQGIWNPVRRRELTKRNAVMTNRTPTMTGMLRMTRDLESGEGKMIGQRSRTLYRPNDSHVLTSNMTPSKIGHRGLAQGQVSLQSPNSSMICHIALTTMDLTNFSPAEIISIVFIPYLHIANAAIRHLSMT